jgi:ribose 5-phosphate isomerase B
MKVIFATDHAGFELKNALIEHVESLGHTVEDMGAHEAVSDDDYPDYIRPAARAVAEAGARGEEVRGIILGGSGQGEAIVANRVPGVRAVVYYGEPSDILHLSREHNDANILSLGARFLATEEAKHAVATWLATSFSHDERHVRRIRKIDA